MCSDLCALGCAAVETELSAVECSALIAMELVIVQIVAVVAVVVIVAILVLGVEPEHLISVSVGCDNAAGQPYVVVASCQNREWVAA